MSALARATARVLTEWEAMRTRSSRSTGEESRPFGVRGLATRVPEARTERRSWRSGMRRLLTLVPIAALLTACEDADNPGNDNLLTGGSLVLIVIIVVVVILMLRRG